jgi:nitrate/nitrite transporter NarK
MINFVGVVPAGGLQLYTPSIVKALGFSTVDANALSSVGSYGGIFLSVILGILADKTGMVGVYCNVPFCWELIFIGAFYGLPTTADKWTKYAIIIIANMAILIVQPINNAWISLNSRTPQQRSIGLAMNVMAANLGGLAGQQLIQSNDAPQYRNALRAIMALYAGSILFVIAQVYQYFWSNKRLARRQEEIENNVEDRSELTEAAWRYKL